MASYLTVPEFRVRTVMSNASVDELEVREPGFLDAALSDWSAWIDARLSKRYAAPFTAPYPIVIRKWLDHLVTPEAYTKLGWSPSSVSDQAIVERATRARDEIKEAADSKDGLFELPLRSDTTATGVSKGGPLACSEASPYAWMSKQAATGRSEDGS